MSSPSGTAPATPPDTVAAAEKEGKLIVYSTTDTAIVASILKDFAALHPKIPVEYNDMNSTELYNRFLAEAAAGSGSGDFLWSSAMDLQLKLANDGYALEYKSPEASGLPAWASWKNEAFATTFETSGDSEGDRRSSSGQGCDARHESRYQREQERCEEDPGESAHRHHG